MRWIKSAWVVLTIVVAAGTPGWAASRGGDYKASTTSSDSGKIMAKADKLSIPYVDPSVQHVGISRLRALNVSQLRALDKTLIIQDNDEPLAVLLKYEHFLAMQQKIGDEE